MKKRNYAAVMILGEDKIISDRVNMLSHGVAALSAESKFIRE